MGKLGLLYPFENEKEMEIKRMRIKRRMRFPLKGYWALSNPITTPGRNASC